jgi:hypothetical protein
MFSSIITAAVLHLRTVRLCTTTYVVTNKNYTVNTSSYFVATVTHNSCASSILRGSRQEYHNGTHLCGTGNG